MENVKKIAVMCMILLFSLSACGSNLSFQSKVTLNVKWKMEMP